MSFIKFLFTKAFLKQFTIAVIALVVFIVILLFWLKSTTNHNQKIEVPDLSKMSLEKVEEVLNDLDLRWELIDSTNYNPDYPNKSVIEQIPTPGKFVKENRKIYITLNTSQYRNITIPNVVGRTRRQAEPTLLALGFKIGKITYRPYIAKDEVLQLRHKGAVLKPGTKLPKTSTIDLVLGDGKGNLNRNAEDTTKDDDTKASEENKENNING